MAVNRRKQQDGQPEADFFNVSAWRELGENCAKYLAKGRKVCVVGSVSCRAYTRNDGTAGASLEVQANNVEFLTPKGEGQENGQAAPQTAQPMPQQYTQYAAPAAQPVQQYAQPLYQPAPQPLAQTYVQPAQPHVQYAQTLPPQTAPVQATQQTPPGYTKVDTDDLPFDLPGERR